MMAQRVSTEARIRTYTGTPIKKLRRALLADFGS
jgi:hypothetical protein